MFFIFPEMFWVYSEKVTKCFNSNCPQVKIRNYLFVSRNLGENLFFSSKHLGYIFLYLKCFLIVWCLDPSLSTNMLLVYIVLGYYVILECYISYVEVSTYKSFFSIVL